MNRDIYAEADKFIALGGIKAMLERQSAKPTAIPAKVCAASRRMAGKQGRDLPWWWIEPPASGIPVVFNGGGTYRAGVTGWIINGHAREVFIGEQNEKAKVGEFIVMTEGGSQVLAQVGRDFDFITSR